MEENNDLKKDNKWIVVLITLLILALIIVGIIVALKITDNQKITEDNKDINVIDNNSDKDAEDLNNNFACFDELKNTEYSGTTTEQDWCELKFDKNGKPTIDMGYKKENETISYGTAEKFSNILEDVAAGSTYVTFNFEGLSKDRKTISGQGTIRYSNVSSDAPITVTLKYSTGIEKTIDVYKK